MSGLKRKSQFFIVVNLVLVVSVSRDTIFFCKQYHSSNIALKAFKWFNKGFNPLDEGVKISQCILLLGFTLMATDFQCSLHHLNIISTELSILGILISVNEKAKASLNYYLTNKNLSIYMLFVGWYFKSLVQKIG